MSGLLESNLKALARRDPELADELRRIKPSPAVMVETSKSGLPTASIHSGGGTIRIHSRYDPLREYGRWGKGSKKKQGPLYGLKKDVWQALALLLAWADENGYQVPINGFNPAPAQEGGMRMK